MTPAIEIPAATRAKLCEGDPKRPSASALAAAKRLLTECAAARGLAIEPSDAEALALTRVAHLEKEHRGGAVNVEKSIETILSGPSARAIDAGQDRDDEPNR